jgi:hypothetical protein
MFNFSWNIRRHWPSARSNRVDHSPVLKRPSSLATYWRDCDDHVFALRAQRGSIHPVSPSASASKRGADWPFISKKRGVDPVLMKVRSAMRAPHWNRPWGEMRYPKGIPYSIGFERGLSRHFLVIHLPFAQHCRVARSPRHCRPSPKNQESSMNALQSSSS